MKSCPPNFGAAFGVAKMLAYLVSHSKRRGGSVAEGLGRRAPDLKSGGPGFKSRSDRYLELFHGRPGFNSLATLVNSQLVCLLPAGIFNLLCSVCYNHLPRVNEGQRGQPFVAVKSEYFTRFRPSELI